MENREKTKNRGIWCGIVASEPELDHQITDKETGEVIRDYYLLSIKVDYSNDKGTINDSSTLPVLVSNQKMERMNGAIKKGTILFVKGEWRAFQKEEDGRKKTVTRIQANHVEVQEKMMRTRNKIELVGKLATKLYKAKFGEDGKMEYNEKGKPVPVLDEEGKKIPWVRRNPEGFTVNDFHLEVKGLRRERTGEVVGIKYKDFIPCIGYGAVAWRVAREIEIDTPVRAVGYIRKRQKNGKDEFVYEAVITEIHLL